MAAALVCLLRRNFDAAFIVATIGAVAWFLNYRQQMKKFTALADEANEQNGNAESNEE
jgi:hypothetical protein